MQSYYVDEWQAQGILLEATFTPLSFGAQWLPGRRRRLHASASSASTTSPRSASTCTTTPRAASGCAATARCGSPTSSAARRRGRIQFGIARAAEIHFAAGATEVYPNIGAGAR